MLDNILCVCIPSHTISLLTFNYINVAFTKLCGVYSDIWINAVNVSGPSLDKLTSLF